MNLTENPEVTKITEQTNQLVPKEILNCVAALQDIVLLCKC